MLPEIADYNNSPEADEYKSICDILSREMDANLPGSESKIWHAHPVWFLDGNPVAGYALQKKGIKLLFWSGQSFDEPDLKPTGKFKAAEKIYTLPEQINTDDLHRWLEKAIRIQWDYKNLVKRKGILERLK